MAGPDGAMWFTNYGNTSIGRISTSGVITNYNGTGINLPAGITAGPDGAIWFSGQNSVGRITTSVTPSIGGFTPSSATSGTTIAITGQHLPGATQVTFNGVPASIASDTTTEIVVTVPSTASDGHIAVTTPAGTATSPGIFTVT